MNADDYMKSYLPDFDSAEMRKHYQEFTHEELIEGLIMTHKNVRVMAMTADMFQNRLRRISAITEESSVLPSVDVPPSNFPSESQ